MSAIVFDAESTGIKNAQIIEGAHCDFAVSDGISICSPIETERFNPSIPIEFGAMATHHIMAQDLVGCRPSAEFALPEGVEYLIGHNIDYDWNLIGEPDVKRICTLALSRMLWPEADSHKQMALCYMLMPDMAREYGIHAHGAEIDVRILTHLLQIICDNLYIESIGGLYNVSEEARIPTRMPFGKHKGLLMEDVPKSYFSWLLGQPDVDQYLRRAIEMVY